LLQFFSNKALANPSIAAEDLPDFEGMVGQVILMNALLLVLFIFWQPKYSPFFKVPALPGMVAEVMKRYLFVPYSLRSQEKRKKALDEEGIDELVHHIDQLAQIFARIAKESGFLRDVFVHVKLKVVESDGCRFWHQDCVPFRLCATFRGPCTEWVPPAFSKITLARRKFDSKHAQSLSLCDVALFKGRGDADAVLLHDLPGIVHRSPRIEGTRMSRLLLVIDIPQEGWHYD
jgi:hypothetical protein